MMRGTGFWEKALIGVQDDNPEPAAPLSAEDIELSNWGEQRSALGLADSSDFIGVRAWERPRRYIHHEPTAMETYASERESLGIKDAGEGSVVPGAGRSVSSVRTNRSPWRAV